MDLTGRELYRSTAYLKGVRFRRIINIGNLAPRLYIRICEITFFQDCFIRNESTSVYILKFRYSEESMITVTIRNVMIAIFSNRHK